ncbi:MAG TPA: TSUP family transporter [Gemmatimonadaceae bacterium]|nr:TSUP family transporter [Gemmatimonadaceae bacterium]
MLFLFLLSAIAGAVASVTGFGIGSILTPFVALSVGTPLAVAVVSIPHFVGTAVRYATLWRHTAWPVLLRFGLASAAGGLAGALLQPAFGARGLTLLLGALLVLTAIASLTGVLERRAWPPGIAVTLGAVSGAFGGLVGNQGGVRSGALLAFRLEPLAFIATATATGLIVDAARLPVYLARSADALAAVAQDIGVMTSGVVLGTVLGQRLLRRLPRDLFRKIVGAAVGLIGIWLIVSA